MSRNNKSMMIYFHHFTIILVLLQLVSTGPIAQQDLSSNLPYRFPDDKQHLLNDFQLAAIRELSELPEYGGRANILDPEAYMTIEEIIAYHGYPVEIYTVVTKDGYILTIQRIPHGKNGPGTKPRKPVLIQHGIQNSAASFITNTADKNLPYLVAEAGYDVWLGNIRGTLYGRNHTTLSPKDDKFWEFSFDQMAKYDVPAVIDFILAKTGYKQIYYIGHSMGTTMMFALLSSQPKYNNIVKTFFALAPVVRMNNVKTPLKYLAPFSSQLQWIVSMIGTGEFIPNSSFLKFLVSTVCTSSIKFFCSNILFIICGYNEAQFNVTRMPVHFHHTPAATSVQTIVHYAQYIQTGKFQQYNYGSKKNEKIYGQLTPPEYNLSEVKTQVALFWSDNDWLSGQSDVSWLATKLANLILKYRVRDNKFAHMDFLWAINSTSLVYDKLIKTMNDFWKD